jgi:nitrogen PTS system EIIA component
LSLGHATVLNPSFVIAEIMKVSEILSAGDVKVDAVFVDKQKLLEDLARRAASAVDLDADLILTALEKREQLGSTGMGGGVALPHARIQQIRTPFGMLVRLKKSIDFDAVDGKPVDMIALLLLPDTQEGKQFGALACIARRLRDPAVLTALRQARDATELYRDLVAAD